MHHMKQPITKLPPFMGLEGSLPYPKNPATFSYEFNPFYYTYIVINFNIILQLHLGLTRLFPKSFKDQCHV